MINSSAPRLYLDTNVFIATFEANDQNSFHLFAGNPRRQESFLFTSLLTRAELLVYPYRNNDDRLIDVYLNWTVSNAILSVGEIDGEVLRYAAVLRAQYQSLKLPDAVHLSTAIGFECTHFVSFDQGFQQMDSITHTMHETTRTVPAPKYINPSDSSFVNVVRQVLI
jgi:predicted nucleic acid-binding protein